jgi:NADH:ubiquinone oxidoreductase subunit F (NADH-binding)
MQMAARERTTGPSGGRRRAPRPAWAAALPLLDLAEARTQAPPPDRTELEALAARWSRPVAAVRAALRSFPDLTHPAPAVRVCRGTSCELAGAAARTAALEARGPVRPAYCLGHCDRSPVALDEAGGVHTDLGADAAARLSAPAPAPPAPRVRCLAPEPIATRRIGRGDLSSLEAARADGAWETLETARRGAPADVLAALDRSRQRGRGGAGFETATKWRACAAAPGAVKVIVANGDEGDPGSFVDRVLLERDPHAVLEGMALAAFAVGASRGIVFVRSEYPEAAARMEQAIAEACEAGLLGPGDGRAPGLEVIVFRGLGGYVCGEETALLNTLEGRRGEVRLRPPYPAEAGLFGWPTLVQNVETLASVPWIVARGGEAFAALGTRASTGTKALCLNAGFPKPGIVEVPFGTSLRHVVEEVGGLALGGEATEPALLLGGPMGSLLLPGECDVPICYDAMAERGLRLGHGGLVAIPPGTDLRALLLHHLTFMEEESCGKCVPCRVGSRMARDLVRDGVPGGEVELAALLDAMESASLCGFGQGMPGPMKRMLALAGPGLLRGDAW